MFFGLTIEKLLLIGVIAALIIGPERLPKYAESLARLSKRAREAMQGAKTRMRDEMGPDFDDVDWRKLDPRQYDPRRIIREALLEDTPTATMRAAGAAALATQAGSDKTAVPPIFVPGQTPPFDDEAT